MSFSNDNSTWSAWEAYASSKGWTLSAGDGMKTVYAQFRDAAGNVSATSSATILLDRSPPSGQVTINGGAASTATAAVTLAVSSTDVGSGVSQMRFSNDNSTWSAWEAYATSKAWNLSAGDGMKTVYAQFRDAAGNVSASYSAQITLSTAVSPSITQQPQDQRVNVGSTATFAVAASGTTPFSYQWKFKGTAIAGAIEASLVINDVGAANAGSYSVDVSNRVGTVPSAAATLTVTPLPLTVTGLTANSKVYDRTTGATLVTAGARLSGVRPADAGNVSLVTSGATGAFADKNVGAGKTVTVSGLTLAGAVAANYTLTPPTTTASITAKGLTVTGLTANDKLYDGNTTATLNTGSAALVGVVSGDLVTLYTGGAVGTFANKAAGAGKAVTVSGLTLAGADAANYSLTPLTTSGSITLGTPPVLENLVLAGNGGRLESFTAQYNDTTWAANRLNDGTRQGPGGSWASPPFPAGPHGFVYGFRYHQAARMDYALLYNFGEGGGAYCSREIEFHVSNDGVLWTFVTNGVLAQVEGPQFFDLRAVTGRYVKVVVTSGYASTYWELGEIEVYGAMVPDTNLLLPASGGRLESFISEYNHSAWAASNLTDGVRQGMGHSWASVAYPSSPQTFEYSFQHHQAARLGYAVVCNYGEAGFAYASQGLEFYVSSDRTTWTFLTNGTLSATGDPQIFDLRGVVGRYLKLAVTDGFSPYYWELGEVEVYGTLIADPNLVLPANGGRLESFISEYNHTTWAAANLTDGLRQGAGHCWASVAYPRSPQSFEYSFQQHQAARLGYAVLCNYGESGFAYASRGVEFYVSSDRTTWTFLASGTLSPNGDPQFFELGGVVGRYVKVVVTSGYAPTYWELGELEVYGALLVDTNLVLPANGGRLEAFSSEYSHTTWAASNLTDGVQQGVGHSWASTAYPAAPQEFVYSFQSQQAARLDYALVYNFGESGGASASRAIEFYASWDREHWALIGSGVLAQTEAPQVLELGGARGFYLKVAVTSGYDRSYWELGEIEVYGALIADTNLLSPANGGKLEAFTSQYNDSAWSAARLTDGTRQGIGCSWASKAYPAAPQEFVYSLANQQAARLDYLIVYNFGESGEAYASRGIECYVSWDRAHWTLVGSGVLAQREGPQAVALGGARGFYVKVVVTSGYAQTYWELGELEVYGSLIADANLLLPANGGKLEAFTSQYDPSTWAAANLTDGVQQGVGHSWATTAYPSAPQRFVYSLKDLRLAQLDWALVYNFGESGGAYASRAVEFEVSEDAVNWRPAGGGVLLGAEGPQWIDLGGNTGRYLRLNVTQGYAQEYWELGELEVYGTLGAAGP